MKILTGGWVVVVAVVSVVVRSATKLLMCIHLIVAVASTWLG